MTDTESLTHCSDEVGALHTAAGGSAGFGRRVDLAREGASFRT